MYRHLLAKLTHWQPEWKEHTLKNTLLLVALILDQKTPSLWKLKGSVGKLLGNTHTDSRSHYQRLKRWLWQGVGQKRLWVQIVAASHQLLTRKTSVLVLDGSSWQSGGVCYHFLTLCVIYRGVSVPVWWLDLGRMGSSHYHHRKLLLKAALLVLDLRGKTLVADREYIGQAWFRFLLEKGLFFVIRIRTHDYQPCIEAQGRPVGKLENKAKAAVGRPVWKRFQMGGQTYIYVLVAYRNRNRKTEWLRLLTTLSPAQALKAYGQRYRVESMFKHLKSNGFDLESLNVKHSYKVQLMMAVVVLAYSLAVVYGLADFKRRISLKKHGCPQMSVFRFGLDKWQNYLQSLEHFVGQLIRYWTQWKKAKSNCSPAHVP